MRGKSEGKILMGVSVESNEPVVVERGGEKDRKRIWQDLILIF